MQEIKEISEEKILGSKFTLSLQTMIAAGTGLASLIGMWYALQADIQEAKELPVPLSLFSQEYPSILALHITYPKDPQKLNVSKPTESANMSI